MDALNREVLQCLGIEEKQWPDLAAKLVEASVVEVSIPHSADDRNWEARVFPWEVFLTVATKRVRGASNLFVVRHLNMETDANPAVNSNSLLYVESAPDTLRENWYFDREPRAGEGQPQGIRVQRGHRSHTGGVGEARG